MAKTPRIQSFDDIQGFRPDELEPKPDISEMSPDGDIVIEIVDAEQPEPGEGYIDPNSGVLKIETGDGGVIIDMTPQGNKSPEASNHDANLAEIIDPNELMRIGAMLLEAIEADEQSRDEWMQTRSKGIEMLGFKLEQARSDVGGSSGSLEGMSTVRHPLLAEAVIRFQSNASAELLPTSGPVKVRNDTPSAPPNAATSPLVDPEEFIAGMGHNGGPPIQEDPRTTPPGGLDGDDLAEALEKDMNHYLTQTDKGYRPDTDRMLFMVGFGGCGFKKIYRDPIKRMPISRSVDAQDLIVSNAANDLDDAGRVTHRILMRRSTMVRMQIAGAYRKTAFHDPHSQPTEVDRQIAEVQGFRVDNQRPEDMLTTIYESYVELDIVGFEHKDKDGNQTGLQLPYRVTIDKDSREVLEIRRNWREDDPDCIAKRVFVKYPFVPAFGFYDIGLLQILGNADRALTAAWRVMLDSGMFANFPGFLYSDAASKQLTNEFRIPPGGGMRVQTTAGADIRQAIMPLPYKEPGPGMLSLIQAIEATSQRVGGTADMPLAEGKQDAPVGTTLALIEQATKMLSAVHIRLHAAQSEEFQLLKDLFKEDPEAFWRQNKRPARQWEVQEFLAALDNMDVVPAADPNTPSHMHRLMKAMAIKQLQGLNPELYDARAVDEKIMRMIGVSDPESLFAPPPDPNAQPSADPAAMAKMAELQLKGQQQQMEAAAKMHQTQIDAANAARDQQLHAHETAVDSAERAQDRAAREQENKNKMDLERLRIAGEMAKLQAQIRDNAADRQQNQHLAGADMLHEHHMRMVDHALTPPPEPPEEKISKPS